MKIERDGKGITLVSLVITIAVLIILAGITTYSGINIIRQSKLNAFTTEMKVMQTEVNDLYDKYTSGDESVLELGSDGPSNLSDDYRYYNQATIQSLGIDGVDGEFYVDVKTRSVISREGLEYEGKTYYTLDELPNGLYNVTYEDRNDVEPPTFDVSTQDLGDGTWKITISNISYGGYISKWQVQYQKNGEDNWVTSEDLTFTIPEDGTYKIKIVNGSVESDSSKTITLQ